MLSCTCAFRAPPRFCLGAAAGFVADEFDVPPVDAGGSDGFVVVTGEASGCGFVACVRSDTIDADRARFVELLQTRADRQRTAEHHTAYGSAPFIFRPLPLPPRADDVWFRLWYRVSRLRVQSVQRRQIGRAHV